MIYTAYNFQSLPSKIKNSLRKLSINPDIQESWLTVSEKVMENNLSFYYIEESNGLITNFIVSSIVENLDCSLFISDEKILQQISKKRKTEADFYKFKILFLGAPMSMETGIYYNNYTQFKTFFNNFQNYMFTSQKIDGIFVTSTSLDTNKIESENIVSFPYYPNTILKLPFNNFEEYLNSRKKKKRWDIKNKQKKFKESGCSIEIIPNSQIKEEEYATIFKLYQNTENNNPDTINYQHYSTKNQFKDLINLPDNYNWVLAKKNSKIIAFALLVSNKERLVLKHIGLDYSINRQTYSYFNLFFSTINFAINNGYKSILCGSTTYDVKIGLGCELIDRTASIVFNNQENSPLELFNALKFGEVYGE